MIESAGEAALTRDEAMPEVTIVIPCFRQAHYLNECLSSLKAQTFAGWRAIVVDDHSPIEDQIRKVVEDFGDPRVRLVRHEKNGGLGASRNTGFRLSETELVLPACQWPRDGGLTFRRGCRGPISRLRRPCRANRRRRRIRPPIPPPHPRRGCPGRRRNRLRRCPH